jgi:hypothetical protein
VTRLPSVAAFLALAALAAAPGAARPASLAFRLEITADDKEEPLRAPEGIACTDRGALVVADTGNGRLLTYTYRDGRLTGGKPVKLPEASYPVRVQIDSRGNVLVLDRKTRRIVRVDAAGAFAGAVTLKGAASPEPVPTSFKVGPADELIVLDIAGRRVLVAGADGRVSRELPLPASGEEFTDVALDAAGRIVALDAVGSRLWAAAKGETAFKPLGQGMKDRIAFPVYLTDAGGRFLVVDQHGHGVAWVGPDGNLTGRELEMGWIKGQVYYPEQLCIGGEGLIFIADRNNNRVQAFSEGR